MTLFVTERCLPQGRQVQRHPRREGGSLVRVAGVRKRKLPWVWNPHTACLFLFRSTAVTVVRRRLRCGRKLPKPFRSFRFFELPPYEATGTYPAGRLCFFFKHQTHPVQKQPNTRGRKPATSKLKTMRSWVHNPPSTLPTSPRAAAE